MHSTLEEVSELIRKVLRAEISKISSLQNLKQEDEPLIKIGEVVKILHVSKPTIFSWIRRKKIPCHRMGSRLYFKRSEILNALKNNSK
mgnify:CR=1 FL=1